MGRFAFHTLLLICLVSTVLAAKLAASHKLLWGNANANTWNPNFSGWNTMGANMGYPQNNYAASWNPGFSGVNPAANSYQASWNPNFSGVGRGWKHA